MSESCPVCESGDVEVHGPYRGVHATFAGLHRSHCSACGMVFAAPMPNDERLDEYNTRYFASAHGGRPDDPVAKAFFSGMARLRLAHVDRYLVKHNIYVAQVLEIGPGPGFFARSWLENHATTSYSAVETDTSCHALLKGAGVHVVDGMADECEAVDLVVMSHVVEHVSKPIPFLRDASRNLRTGGAFFVEVPCRDWEHKLVDEPHLLFFDEGPMRRTLKTLGFDNIECSYHGEEIARLRSRSLLRGKWMAVRSRLIALGLIAPFARIRPGLEMLADPLERAAVAPFKAHRASSNPARWLRAVARKD